VTAAGGRRNDRVKIIRAAVNKAFIKVTFARRLLSRFRKTLRRKTDTKTRIFRQAAESLYATIHNLAEYLIEIELLEDDIKGYR
jgi:hypothetical protein